MVSDAGAVVVDPLAINARFAYYSGIYSFKVDYSGVELSLFPDQITFPTLSETARETLDGFITVEEVQQALSDLQAGKTPAWMGSPLNFTSSMVSNLCLKVHEMIIKTLKDGTLPASMAKVVTVVIPKPGKNPEYLSISLLNADAKVLTTFLAQRLNKVLYLPWSMRIKLVLYRVRAQI